MWIYYLIFDRTFQSVLHAFCFLYVFSSSYYQKTKKGWLSISGSHPFIICICYYSFVNSWDMMLRIISAARERWLIWFFSSAFISA